jgi:hypothetical protein
MQRFVLAQPTESAYQRDVLFAIEVLDAVTLERISDGIEVIAEGLQQRPVVNTSGLFVWRGNDSTALQRIRIEPGLQPYEGRTIERADLTLDPNPRPLTTVQLSPRANYSFASGTTGARGRLVETDSDPRVPVAGAAISLRWLDDDGTTWHDAPVESRTTKAGDFVTVLRLTPADTPLVDAAGALAVRVRVRRNAATRFSPVLKLPQGRVADPSTLASLLLAWDALQP